MSPDTPPVCDYEGSDYQKRFWEEGGRAYEDAVEAIALKRLLPPGGRLLLELGAGAGRNTPRCQGFERVVLLDYSRTQLAQARDRLGNAGRYIYVAADVYRLPFGASLFDAATMIRTLHHMADPELALSQVQRVMAPGGTFVLEFANKRNLKAMLRYLFHRQTWNPYDQTPVEFAPLNFDFHPRAVRRYLHDLDFQIERQLAVSHFRVGFLKRHLPTWLLTRLDAMLQWTGALVQISPSEFTRSRLVKQSRRTDGGTFFQCPVCGAALGAPDETDLVCAQCGAVWPYSEEIYDFRIRENQPNAQM